jgi:hypothetical protein
MIFPPITSFVGMKTILPVEGWVDGVLVSATVLQLECIEDDLFSSAIFSYRLLSVDSFGYLKDQISSDELEMTGSTYDAWTTNEQAFEWASSELNITITGNYNPSPQAFPR